MITQNAVEFDRVGKIARLEVDNARLRKLVAEINAHVRELRLAAGTTSGRSAIDPPHRLVVMSGGELRARGA